MRQNCAWRLRTDFTAGCLKKFPFIRRTQNPFSGYIYLNYKDNKLNLIIKKTNEHLCISQFQALPSPPPPTPPPGIWPKFLPGTGIWLGQGIWPEDQLIANANLNDFYVFFIDNSMFSLQICRYSMGKLMIEVLKMVKSVKFIKIRGPREARPL